MNAALLVLVAVVGVQASEVPTLILPEGNDAWVVHIATSGGFTGRGSGSFTANSVGDVVCVTAGACPAHLIPGTRRTLAGLVTAIPLNARQSSPSPSSTCNDCVTTTMTVRRRDAGAEQTFTYTWDVSTSAAVPEPVLRLHAAVVALASRDK